MKKNPKEFYDFLKKTCDFRSDLKCFKSKRNPVLCIFESCSYIKKENKDILNPAMELLRILDIDFIHIARTKTSAKDVIKGNKGLADLFIFMDNNLLVVELKTKQGKLSGIQKEKANRFRLKGYVKYDILNNLFDFYTNIISYRSEREDIIIRKNAIKIQKWFIDNNVK